MSQGERSGLVSFFERSIATWASDPAVTLAVGSWSDGVVMELVGSARMLPGRYEGCFEGVRELRALEGGDHAHIDLARIHSIEYVIAPSVCLGFRPSLEVRYLCMGPGGARTGRVMLRGLLVSPYTNNGVNQSELSRWYQQYQREVRERPDRVRMVFDSGLSNTKDGEHLLAALAEISQRAMTSWAEAAKLLTSEERAPLPPSEPVFRALVEEAIALHDASLVIYRDKTLIEFKTDALGGLFEYREGDHVSWQLGRFEGHHCHLALSAVTSVEFSAEPVPCQGGRLNYTIWFLISGGCGNPFRSDGYFSVTLNRPYEKDEPRWGVILPVLGLFERYQHHPWVRADETFLRMLTEFKQEGACLA